MNIKSIYHGQRDRCRNKKCSAYRNYGAKGIDQEYTFGDFKKFILSLDPMFESKQGLVVGRIDHSKNYSIDNIRIETKRYSAKERMSRVINPMRSFSNVILIVDLKTRNILFTAINSRHAEKITGIGKSTVNFRTQVNSGLKKPKRNMYRKAVDFVYIGDYE